MKVRNKLTGEVYEVEDDTAAFYIDSKYKVAFRRDEVEVVTDDPPAPPEPVYRDVSAECEADDTDLMHGKNTQVMTLVQDRRTYRLRKVLVRLAEEAIVEEKGVTPQWAFIVERRD